MKKIPLLIAGLLLVSISMMAQDKKPAAIPADVEKLLTQYACLACHKADAKVIGPAYAEVAQKKYTDAQIVELIYTPKPANWPGFPPMVPMKHVPKDDALKIAGWINSLASSKKQKI